MLHWVGFVWVDYINRAQCRAFNLCLTKSRFCSRSARFDFSLEIVLRNDCSFFNVTDRSVLNTRISDPVKLRSNRTRYHALRHAELSGWRVQGILNDP